MRDSNHSSSSSRHHHSEHSESESYRKRTSSSVSGSSYDTGDGTHHHHHHHHHKKRGPFARLKRRLAKHKKEVTLVAVLFLVVLGFFGFFAYRHLGSQNSMHVESRNSYDMGAGYRNIVYNGKKYEYNQLITTVLYIGVDALGEMQTFPRSGMAPRSDSMNLVVLDKKHQKLSIISVNRDTILRLRRYSLLLDYWEYYESQLAYAYAFGDGAELSSGNVVEAVSNLLGVPIDDFVVTNRDSIAGLNDLVGGVTVTVPNNDLVAQHPEMKAGATVDLTADNVSDFVRYRDTGHDFSNAGRLDRQKTFISAYVKKLQGLFPDKINEFWNSLSGIEHYMQTSITRNKYLKYANLLDKLEYEDTSFYQIPGEYRNGEFHDEFYVDVDAMKEMVIDLFYDLA